MLTLRCKIQITSKDTQKKVILEYVSSVSISTSVETLTDTATIVMPCKLKKITETVKKGDSVAIYLWYDEYPDYSPIFLGYVRNIVTSPTITLECENEMWKLKQIKVPAKRYTKFDLQNFFSEFIPGIEVKVPKEMSFGEVIIANESTVAKVMDYLTKNYPFNVFFKERSLVCSMRTSLVAESAKEVTFKIGSNIISDSLKYVKAEDVNIIVKAKSILKDNTKLEVQSPIGATEGEIRTLHNSALKTKKELQKYADEQLANWKSDKMTGEFVAFGIPLVYKCDLVKILDDENPDRNNKKFVVASVNYSFGTGGFRQTIKLGDELK